MTTQNVHKKILHELHFKWIILIKAIVYYWPGDLEWISINLSESAVLSLQTKAVVKRLTEPKPTV